MKSFLSALLILTCATILVGCDALDPSSGAKRRVELSGPSIDEVGTPAASTNSPSATEQPNPQAEAQPVLSDAATNKEISSAPGSAKIKDPQKPTQLDAGSLFHTDSQGNAQSDSPAFK